MNLQEDSVVNSVGEGFSHSKIEVVLDSTQIHPIIVMETIAQNPDLLLPAGFLSFKKTKGDIAQLSSGDEFLARFFGLWHNKFKVVRASSHDFKLETMELNEKPDTLTFSLLFSQGKWRFLAELVEKKDKKLFHRIIEKMPIMRFSQEKMLKNICQNFANLCSSQRK